MSVPSSTLTPWDAQPQAGYCASQIASAASKADFSVFRILITSVDPQQLVRCCTSVQSVAEVQERSNVGKLVLTPVH
jgi:hypothetical protein